MADSATPRAKKAKRSAPVCRISAEECAKKFKEDIFVDSGVLYCRCCEHSIDFSRVEMENYPKASDEKESGKSRKIIPSIHG